MEEKGSVTVFKDDRDEEIAVMLCHYDGHPAAYGHRLAEYLEWYAAWHEGHDAPLDMNEVAAGVVGKFKRDLDDVSLVAPHAEHEDLSYDYVVRQKGDQLIIDVRDKMKREVIFKGTTNEMLRWAEVLVIDPVALALELLYALGKLAPYQLTGEVMCRLIAKYSRLEDYFALIPGPSWHGKEEGLLVAIGREDDIHARIEAAEKEVLRPTGKNITTVIFWAAKWLWPREWSAYEGAFNLVRRIILKRIDSDPQDLRQMR
ncbi:MAG: hypothetical protein ABSC55_14480 [Syntrophorhabdales bacterium]